MKIKIVSIGKIKDPHLKSLILDYSKKISFDAKLELLEIKDSDKETEANKIIDVVGRCDNCFIYVLSEEGEELNSIKFSKELKKHSLENKNIVFIIGGPFGLSKKVKEISNTVFSLSKMTFMHEMAKLFLVEQIYRAISIIKNKKYHKE